MSIMTIVIKGPILQWIRLGYKLGKTLSNMSNKYNKYYSIRFSTNVCSGRISMLFLHNELVVRLGRTGGRWPVAKPTDLHGLNNLMQD